MSILSSLHAATPPPVAVELAANRVSAAAIEFRGGKAVVSAHASEPLPEGVLVPSLTGDQHPRSRGAHRRARPGLRSPRRPPAARSAW